MKKPAGFGPAPVSGSLSNEDQLLEDIGFVCYETYSLVDGQDNPIGIGQIMHRNDRLHLGRILIAPSKNGVRDLAVFYVKH